MRVLKGRVVGNAIIIEETLPEGSAVDVVVHEAGDDEGGIHVDEATEEELLQAMAEADTEEGISVEEAFARLPPRKRTA
jgi:hypothetical protein